LPAAFPWLHSQITEPEPPAQASSGKIDEIAGASCAHSAHQNVAADEFFLHIVEHLLTAIGRTQVCGDRDGSGPTGAAIVSLAAARLAAIDGTMMVCAPARAKSTAISRPMPRLPPVMTTTFPENSPGILRSFLEFVRRW
jgi:hypothetical protein